MSHITHMSHKFSNGDRVYVAETSTVYFIDGISGRNYSIHCKGEVYSRLVATSWIDSYGKKVDEFEAELLELDCGEGFKYV